MGTDAAFATLGLAAGAPSEQITRAFRALCSALHPDHGGDAASFQAVVGAYRTLQSCGHVTPPCERPRAGAPSSAAGATRAAVLRNPYAELQRDLERFAAMVPTRRSPRPVRRRPVPRPQPIPFAEVLDGVLSHWAS